MIRRALIIFALYGLVTGYIALINWLVDRTLVP
jgi:hypothetical protein